jgi:tetratricopeptide (TPR) repeat protein
MRNDPRGIEVLREAAELASSINSQQASPAYNNLGIFQFQLGDVPEAMETLERSRQAAVRFGLRAQIRFQDGILSANSWVLGDWETSLALADRFIRECEEGSPHYQEFTVRGIRALIRLARGDRDGGLADMERSLALVHGSQEPQSVGPALGRAIHVLGDLGLEERAAQLAREAMPIARVLPAAPLLGDLSWYAARLGVGDELREIVAAQPESVWREGVLAVLEGDFERAAAAYESVGARTIAALARLYGAEAAAVRGEDDRARRLIDSATPFFREVQATAYLGRAEALLAASA